MARARQDVVFLFMNTQELWTREDTPPPSNILYLPMTLDEERKSAFIRTCDAMLHARRSGETFGLAIAECARVTLKLLPPSSSRLTIATFTRRTQSLCTTSR